jgi:type IV fimbrial biogenesis protein FimT
MHPGLLSNPPYQKKDAMVKNTRGFTLIEVIVIMGLIAIIAAIATPTFRELRENNQKKTAAFTLGTALNYARNEAITRGVSVTLCRSANPNATDSLTAPVAPVCSTAAGTGWETGFIAFLDSNGNGTRDVNEILIRVFPPPRGNLLIRGGPNNIRYLPTGMATGVTAATFTIGASNTAGTGVDTSQTHFALALAANGTFNTQGPKKN